MGKPSRLREQALLEDQKARETRYTYADGTRKLYDRDKMPDGLDEDIWDLTLYFEQVAECYGQSVAGRPIVYTELSHRIRESGIRATYVEWITIVKAMIKEYWDSETDTVYAINDFCNIDRFDFYMSWVLDNMKRIKLVATGTRVVQQDREVKEPKRKNLRLQTATTEELEDKFKRFRQAQS